MIMPRNEGDFMSNGKHLEGSQTPTNEVENKKNNTGAKKAIGAVSILLLLSGALTLGGMYVKDHVYPAIKEDKRIEQLVGANITNGEGLIMPDKIMIDQAYDLKYADGSTLVEELNERGLKYCEILDEYYTPDGKDIAILTYQVVTRETIDPTKTEIDGRVIYSAPAGYMVDGNICYRDTTAQIVKIVPKDANGDYSKIEVPNVQKYELIDIKETKTSTYDSICDYTIVCDVPDTATLNKDGLCEATLTLKKH